MKKAILICAVVLLTACATGVKSEEIKADSVQADSTHVDSLTVKK